MAVKITMHFTCDTAAEAEELVKTAARLNGGKATASTYTNQPTKPWTERMGESTPSPKPEEPDEPPQTEEKKETLENLEPPGETAQRIGSDTAAAILNFLSEPRTLLQIKNKVVRAPEKHVAKLLKLLWTRDLVGYNDGRWWKL